MTETLTFTINSNDIKAASLLLTRFGKRTDYSFSIEIYQASDDGIPIGLPLGKVSKSAQDIDSTRFYNFIFDPVINNVNGKVAIVTTQTINDGSNYIFWHYEEKYREGWTNSITMPNYGYNYGYLYGAGNYSPYDSDFFDLFTLDSNSIGYVISTYGYTLGYGFEQTLYHSDSSIINCFKLYNAFNEIIYESDRAVALLPNGKSNTIVINNRQDFFDGYRKLVDIVGDKVLLRNIGKRLSYCDLNSPDKEWNPTNKNLPAYINDFSLIKNEDFLSPYKLLGCSACEDGLYVSYNSGSTWSILPYSKNKEFNLCNISNSENYKDGKNKYIIFGINKEHNSSNLFFYICKSNNNKFNDILEFKFKDEFNNNIIDNPLSIKTNWNSSTNTVTIGTDNGLYLSDNSELKNEFKFKLVPNTLGYVIYEIYDFDIDNKILCTDKGLLIFNLTSNSITPNNNSVPFGNIYNFIVYKEKAYICTDNGLVISSDVIGIDPTTIEWKENSPGHSLYLFGIPQVQTRSITKIYDENNNEKSLIVGTNSGVFITDSGFDFQSLNENAYPDIEIKKIIPNNLDNDMIHSLSNTVLNKYPFITIIIDQSGSMYENGNLDQYKLAAETIKEINNYNPNARIQVITFSTSELNSVDITLVNRDAQDRIGASNITNGFINYSEDLYNRIINLKTNSHYKTPLYETLWASLSGIYNGGSGWTYDSKNIKYQFDSTYDPLLEKSDSVIILLTDGNDTNSIKNINDVVDGLSSNQGSKNINSKLYTIAYGEQSNLDTLSEIITLDSEVIYSRNNNINDFNTIYNYITNNEKFRSRSGLYRKNFRFDNLTLVKDIVFDLSIFNETSIKYRYRISDNFYNLGDFNHYDDILITGEFKIDINKTLRFLEIEFLLHSDNINSSPSINGILVNYITPSESNLLLTNYENNLNEKITEIITSVNAKTLQKQSYIYEYGYNYNYGYGYNFNYDYDFFHIFNQGDLSPRLDLNSLFSDSKTNNTNIYKEFKTDKKSYINYRVLEKTTSNNQLIYKAINGPWNQNIEPIIYSGTNIINKNLYSLSSIDGEIIFFEKRNKSESIYITIPYDNKVSLGMKIYNFEDNNILILENISYELLSDENSKNPRKALPIFSSQINSDSSGIVNYSSSVFRNEDNIIVNNEANIDITLLIQSNISNGNEILFGFADFIENPIDNSLIFTQHENGYLFNNMQNSDPDNLSFITIKTSKPNVSFSDINTSSEYSGFIKATLNGTLDKDDRIFINIRNFDTSFYRQNKTRHIKADSNLDLNYKSIANVNGSVMTNFAVMLNNNLFKNTNPFIQISASNEADKIHISCPMTPSTNNILANITIVNNQGVVATKSQAEVLLDVIELDSGNLNQLETITVTFNENDYGNKKVPITLNNNYSNFYISAKFMSTNIIGSSVGGYTTYSNKISLKNGRKILWGDFNVKSSMGDGRQSPNEVFDYAKGYSGLDFCAICDNSNLLTQDDWDLQKNIANFYNVAGSFVTFHGIEWNNINEKGTGYKGIIFGNNGSPSINSINRTDLNSLFVNLINYNPIVFSQHPSYDNKSIFEEYNANYDKIKEASNSLKIENAIEIYSEHGNSESYELNTNAIINRANIQSNSFATNALLKNFKQAFISNSNTKTSKSGLYAGELELTGRVMPPNDETNYCVNNRGITAVISSDFSRDAIFQAIKNRHTYCTTGARIGLEVNLSNFIMGDVVYIKELIKNGNKVTNIPLDFSINVFPIAPSATVNIIEVNITDQTINTVNTSNVNKNNSNITYNANHLIDGKEKTVAYFVRVVQSDRHMAWSTPIFIEYLI